MQKMFEDELYFRQDYSKKAHSQSLAIKLNQVWPLRDRHIEGCAGVKTF
jgi:hypothetical protein